MTPDYIPKIFLKKSHISASSHRGTYAAGSRAVVHCAILQKLKNTEQSWVARAKMQQLILAFRRRPQDIFLRAFADAVRGARCSLPDDIVKRHLLSDRITITKDTWKWIPSGSRSLFAAAQHRQTVRHLSRFRFTNAQTKKSTFPFYWENKNGCFVRVCIKMSY